MTKIYNSGGLVFPCAGYSKGLTTRDYIAIEAMKGMLSNYYEHMSFDESGLDKLTKRSFEIADAMIKQRD